MPSPNFLIRHWKKQLQVALAHVTILKKQIDVEAVHNLRVAIKKIRSYSRLYALICNDKDWKNYFSGTEELFSYLGKQRDVQLSLLLAEKLEKDNLTDYRFFIVHLGSVLHELNRQVIQKLTEYDDAELNNLYKHIQQRAAMLSNEDLQAPFESFVTANLKKATRYKNVDQHAHDTRKLLKDVFYWLSISPFPVFETGTVKNIDKILTALGKWQDNTVLMTKARHFRKDYLVKKNEEFENLKQLEVSLGSRNEKILKAQAVKIKELGMVMNNFKLHQKTQPIVRDNTSEIKPGVDNNYANS